MKHGLRAVWDFTFETHITLGCRGLVTTVWLFLLFITQCGDAVVWIVFAEEEIIAARVQAAGEGQCFCRSSVWGARRELGR